MSEDKGNINDILKALGHKVRRDIIRTIEENNAPLSYSHLLKTLDLPASSNIAYHMKILVDTNLIEKTNEGDYILTKDGKQSTLLFDEVKGSFLMKVSQIGKNFSKLSTSCILLVAWSYFLMATGVVMFFTFLPLGITLTISWILVIAYTSYRIKSIFGYIFIQTFVWIFFLKKNKIMLFAISILGYISPMIIFGTVQVGGNEVSSPIKELVGIIPLIIAIVFSLLYIVLSRKNKGLIFESLENDKIEN